MPEVVGTAWVRIRALTTGLAGEINDALGKVDTDPVARKLGDRTGGVMGKSMTDGIQTHLSEGGLLIPDSVVKKSTQKFGDDFKSGVKNSIGDGSVGKAVDTAENRSWFSRAGHKFATILSKAFGDTNDKEVDKHSKSTKSRITKFFDAIGKLKVPTPVWIGYFGMPLIVGLAKTVTYYIGGLVARTGALLEGIVGLSSAALGALVQSAAVGGLILAAFKTQTPALLKFQADIKGVAAEWKGVGEATQRYLLPGVLESFKTVTKSLVPIFKDLGTWVGAVANNTATAVANLLTSERGMRMWEGFNASTKVTAGNLGRIVTALARGFVPLMDALNPLAVKFSDTLARVVEHWADLLEKGSDSGKLQSTLQKWYDTGEKLVGSLADIFAGLWNILRIGADATGLKALDRFDEFAARFREWTTSIEGENKIRKFFEEAEPVIQEVNGLIGDIFRTFFQRVDTGTGSDTIVSVLQSLRYEILPKVSEAIKGIADSFTGEAGANTKGFVSAFSDLMDAFVKAETLIPTIQVITLLLQALVVVLNTPIVGDIIGPLLALGAAFRLLKATGIVTLLKGIASGIGAIASVIGPLASSVAAGAPLIATITGAFSNWWAVFTLLHPALAGFIAAAAPIAGIIAGIAAVVAGLYFVLDPVRKAIDGIWESLQKLFDWFRNFDITDWQTNLKAALDAFILFTTAIPRVVLAALQGIGEKILQFISNIPGWFSGLASTVGSAVVSAASAAWSWLTSAVSMAAEKVGEFFAALPGAFAGLASQVASAVAGAAVAIFDWVVKAVPKIPYYIGYFIGVLIGLVIGIPVLITTAMAKAAEAIAGWILTGITFLLSNFVAFMSALWGAIAGFIAELPGRIWGAIVAITQWVVDAIPVLLGYLGSFIGAVWGWVSGFISELPGRIMGAIEGIIGWVSSAATQMPGKLAEVASQIWVWVQGLPGTIKGWMWDAASWLLSVGGDILSGLVQGISDGLGAAKDKVLGFLKNLIPGPIAKFLGIGSPSKMTRYFGQMVAAGLALGITDNTKMVENSVSRMLGAVALAPSLLGGSGSFSTSSLLNANLVSSTPSVALTVRIGDRDITDIVDVQITKNNTDLARQLVARNA